LNGRSTDDAINVGVLRIPMLHPVIVVARQEAGRRVCGPFP